MSKISNRYIIYKHHYTNAFYKFSPDESTSRRKVSKKRNNRNSSNGHSYLTPEPAVKPAELSHHTTTLTPPVPESRSVPEFTESAVPDILSPKLKIIASSLESSTSEWNLNSTNGNIIESKKMSLIGVPTQTNNILIIEENISAIPTLAPIMTSETNKRDILSSHSSVAPTFSHPFKIATEHENLDKETAPTHEEEQRTTSSSIEHFNPSREVYFDEKTTTRTIAPEISNSEFQVFFDQSAGNIISTAALSASEFNLTDNVSPVKHNFSPDTIVENDQSKEE